MSFYEWTAWLAACLVVLIGVTYVVDALRKNADDRRVARSADLAAGRDHELALADREVVMWKDALEHPHPIFTMRRAQPVLVGRSQVLDVFDSTKSRPLKARSGWSRQAQQDMPIPVSDDPSPKVPAPPMPPAPMTPDADYEEPRAGDTEVMPGQMGADPNCAYCKGTGKVQGVKCGACWR